jgi:hypothetical protein
MFHTLVASSTARTALVLAYLIDPPLMKLSPASTPRVDLLLARKNRPALSETSPGQVGYRNGSTSCRIHRGNPSIPKASTLRTLSRRHPVFLSTLWSLLYSAQIGFLLYLLYTVFYRKKLGLTFGMILASLQSSY